MNKTKGIILAGGLGTRLSPITKIISKQLLPIYDKPMVYYPISVLMLAEIKDILIISTPHHLNMYEELLGDGSDIGVNFTYKKQPKPEGLAQAFILGEEFIGSDNVCLILGDNVFHGSGMKELLLKSINNVQRSNSASIFGYLVSDPERYGVVELDNEKNVISIEEKPTKPKSNLANVGLYFYPNDVIEIAKGIKPSERGELEITSINNYYLKENKLKCEIMSHGFAWLDTGTHDSLHQASSFVRILQKRQGIKIADLNKIAKENKWI